MNETFQNLLVQLALAAVPVVLLAWTLLMTRAQKALKERLGAGAALDAAEEARLAVDTSVQHLFQTLRPELEAAAADGKLSKEDQRALLETAKKNAKEQLSEQAQAIIKSNGARIEDYLERLIEASVQKQKKE